jgi:4-amino-4-deoxy-L-arabinose transferase-like glycosyltransferase
MMGRPDAILRRLHDLGCFLIAAEALALLALLAYTTLSRVAFPYELEWDEGWTVDSIRRVLAGKNMWVAPTVEWLPYPYPPVYTYLSAAMAKLVGVGFLAPRLVSLGAAAGCLYLVFRLVRRESGRAIFGLAAAGFLAGTYPLSGAWFDIARVDTLFLFFVLAGFEVLRRSASLHASIGAGGFLALAYLTKQTALLPLAALGLYCLSELRGKSRIALVLASGAFIGGATLIFSLLTEGWYFYYTVTVPGLHGLGQEHMLADYWVSDLGIPMIPAGFLAALYLARRFREHSSDFAFYGAAAVSMMGASWISRLHGGGWLNVLQPAHAILAILFGLSLKDLWSLSERHGLRASGLFSVPVLQLALLFYPPGQHIPTDEDVADGDAFVEFLRTVEGEVYTPMHGYLPTLAGKEVFAHDDYLITLLRTGDATVVEPLLGAFRLAFTNERFDAVVIDYEDYRFMDLLREHYRYYGEVPGSFRPRTGPKGAPQKVYVPKGRPFRRRE